MSPDLSINLPPKKCAEKGKKYQKADQIFEEKGKLKKKKKATSPQRVKGKHKEDVVHKNSSEFFGF